MESTRTLCRHGNLKPAVFSLLADLPNGGLRHAEHGLRAPGGIYNLSIGRILRAFVATLDQLDGLGRAAWHPDGRLDFDGAALLTAQTELLESMLAHIDDGYQVLKACHPPQPQVDESFADRWLEKVRHPSVRHFKNAVKSYRDTVAPIVNRVKHEHGQLRFVVFYDDQTRIPGYYLEGVGSDGVLCPDQKIHPGNTALSFNRDLRFHFVHVFEIGNALRSALLAALRARNVRVSGRAVTDPSAELLAVAKRVASLGTTVFPDEATKPTPYVEVRNEADDVELLLRYPSLATFRPPSTMRVTTTIGMDGYSTQYRVPYFATS